MKRVYQQVDIAAVGDGFEIRLDGKPLRSPARAPLLLPRRLAEAVATEWQDQGEQVLPHTMPMMQLASTAVDRVGPQRPAIVAAVAAYAETDLLCYRADQPNDLVRRQMEEWQPLLDWAALTFDAPLQVQVGLMPRPQPAAAVGALRRAVEELAVLPLTGLQNATAACGSLVLALMLLYRRIDPERAYRAAHLDELFQAEKWGEDGEAVARRRRVRDDIHASHRFFDLVVDR